MRRACDRAGDSVTMDLTEDERRLLATLRTLPEGPLRAHVWNMLTAVARMLHDPHCSQVQADGVPCARPSGECAQCQRVLEELDALPAVALPS